MSHALRAVAGSFAGGCTGPAARQPDTTAAPAQQKFSILYFDTFDTLIQLTGYAVDEETFNSVAESAHKSFQRLHMLFDAYHDYTAPGGRQRLHGQSTRSKGARSD